MENQDCSRKGLGGWLGSCADAQRFRPQVSQSLSRLAMAMGIPAEEPVDQCPSKRTRSPSHWRILDPESRERGGHEGRIDKAGHLPYFQAFLRYSLARKRLRYPNGPRTSGPQRCQNDDDLYTCPQPWTGWRSQSSRWTLRSTQRFIMPIRIRRHDKSVNGTQVVEVSWITVLRVDDPAACYTDKKPKFRMLCGSI